MEYLIESLTLTKVVVCTAGMIGLVVLNTIITPKIMNYISKKPTEVVKTEPMTEVVKTEPVTEVIETEAFTQVISNPNVTLGDHNMILDITQILDATDDLDAQITFLYCIMKTMPAGSLNLWQYLHNWCDLQLIKQFDLTEQSIDTLNLLLIIFQDLMGI